MRLVTVSPDLDHQVGQGGVPVASGGRGPAPPTHLQAGHLGLPVRLSPLQLVRDLLQAGWLVRLVGNQVTDFA